LPRLSQAFSAAGLAAAFAFSSKASSKAFPFVAFSLCDGISYLFSSLLALRKDEIEWMS
jgi:hypothetical protein